MRIGAIVGPDGAADDPDCEPNIRTGHRYLATAEYTGGQSASVCDQDWRQAMEDLGLKATGIQDTFLLDRRADPLSLQVQVDDTVVPMADFDRIGTDTPDAHGWTYQDMPPSITFHGDAIPPRGAIIRVEFLVEPGG